MNPALLD